MRIVLLGAPGSGKGTQAAKLAETYRIPKITTGEMLRSAVRDGTDLGRQAKTFMDRGALVPDELIIGLMRERMGKEDASSGYILDGFPRSEGQADALDQLLTESGQQLDYIVALDVHEDELLRRLTGRRECQQCGAGYHIVFQAPATTDICDACGGSLIQRADDTEATIRARLKVYTDETAPLLDYYATQGTLHSVDGVGDMQEVLGRICSVINSSAA